MEVKRDWGGGGNEARTVKVDLGMGSFVYLGVRLVDKDLLHRPRP